MPDVSCFKVTENVVASIPPSIDATRAKSDVGWYICRVQLFCFKTKSVSVSSRCAVFAGERNTILYQRQQLANNCWKDFSFPSLACNYNRLSLHRTDRSIDLINRNRLINLKEEEDCNCSY